MTTRPDIASLVNAFQKAAAVEILPRFLNLGAGDVWTKGEVLHLVTEADVGAIMPDALFVGEKAIASNPALLTSISDADLAIVVVLIDRTYNFAAGAPFFSGLPQRRQGSAPTQPDSLLSLMSAILCPIADTKLLLINLADVHLFPTYSCTAHEYRAMVTPLPDLYSKLMLWDQLAGSLNAQEAGALCSMLRWLPLFCRPIQEAVS